MIWHLHGHISARRVGTRPRVAREARGRALGRAVQTPLRIRDDDMITSGRRRRARACEYHGEYTLILNSNAEFDLNIFGLWFHAPRIGHR